MRATCMGGWCHLRDKCRHHEPLAESRPHERLCNPKQQDAYEPILQIRAAGTWTKLKRGRQAVWMVTA